MITEFGKYWLILRGKPCACQPEGYYAHPRLTEKENNTNLRINNMFFENYNL